MTGPDILRVLALPFLMSSFAGVRKKVRKLWPPGRCAQPAAWLRLSLAHMGRKDRSFWGCANRYSRWVQPVSATVLASVAAGVL